jgi:hypothetical protein
MDLSVNEPGPAPQQEAGPPPREESWAGRVLEMIYGMLFQPVRTARQLAREQPVGMAVAVHVAVTALTGAYNAIVLAGRINIVAGTAVPVTLVAATVSFSLLLWLVYTGVLQIIAELLGGQGRGIALLSVTGFVNLPAIFLPVLALLARLSRLPLETGLSLVLSLWVLVLYVIAVREAHGLSTGRSVLTVLLPLGAAIFVMVLFAVFLVVFLATFPFFRELPGLPGIF